MSTEIYKHCPNIGHGVSVSQTEGQCRDHHNCSDEACPLEKQFGKNRFDRSLNMMAAQIGQAFAPRAD